MDNNFRENSYKAVLYSKELDRYYVSTPCKIEGGATRLSYLFGFEFLIEKINNLKSDTERLAFLQEHNNLTRVVLDNNCTRIELDINEEEAYYNDDTMGEYLDRIDREGSIFTECIGNSKGVFNLLDFLKIKAIPS